MDRVSRDQLATELFPRAQRAARRWSLRAPGLDPDEIESAAMYGLVRALDRYDPQRGELIPYIDMGIKAHIRKAIQRMRGLADIARPEHARVRQAVANASSLSTCDYDGDLLAAHSSEDFYTASARRRAAQPLLAAYGDEERPVEAEVITLDTLRKIIETTHRIDPRNLQILLRSARGESIRAIGEVVGLSRQTVLNRLNHTRRHIAKEFGRESAAA